MKNTVLSECPERATVEWLESLRSCSAYQFRRQVPKGGQPVFVLAPDSTQMNPVWLLLLKQGTGSILRVTTDSDRLARRLTSVRQVYQIARNCGLTCLEIPVDQRK